jgi:hypothetical protein
MNPYNLKVGDKLYYKTNENNPKIGWTTITFVGRKYFQVDAMTGNQLLEDPFKYSRHVQFYPSEQCYLDECEKNKILSQLQDCFSFSGKGRNLSLNQLRQISQIIEGDQDG